MKQKGWQVPRPWGETEVGRTEEKKGARVTGVVGKGACYVRGGWAVEQD